MVEGDLWNNHPEPLYNINTLCRFFLFYQNTPMFSHPYYTQTDPDPNPAPLQCIAELVCVLSVTLCNLVVSAVA